MQSRPTICKLQARESRGAVPGRAQSLGTRGPGARVQGREQQEQGERALPLSALFLYSALGRRDGTRPAPTSSVRTVFLLSLPSETLNSSGINHHNSRKQAKPGRNPDVWFAAEAFAVTTHPCFPKEDSGDLGRSLPRGPQDVAGSQLTVYTSHEMASCHGPSSVLCIARRATAPPAPTR